MKLQRDDEYARDAAAMGWSLIALGGVVLVLIVAVVVGYVWASR